MKNRSRAGKTTFICALAVFGSTAVGCACSGGERGPSGSPGEPGAPGDDVPGLTQGTIEGKITDAEEGAPIEGATVTATPGGMAATSGASGGYTLTALPIGVYTLVVSAAGRTTKTVTGVSVTAGGTTIADVALDAGVVETGSVAGTVQRRTFAGDPAAGVEGATVALVDAFALADSASDAPLEELAASSSLAATTSATGAYEILGVPPGRYYLHVTPAPADDDELLPGGGASRESFEVSIASEAKRDVVVSQKPPSSAHFLGSSICVGCHNGQVASNDQSGWKHTLHALVYRVPGVTSAIQDLSLLPDHDAALLYFKDEVVAPENDRDNTGPGDEYGLRIASAEFPKFPATYNLLLGYDGKYFVRFESPAGLVSMKYYAEFTFGGHGLYKERWVTRAATDGSYAASPSTPSSYYVLPLQFDEQLQPGVEPFHPYNPANWAPPTAQGGPAVRPAQNKSFDNNCAGCHFTGMSLSRDAEGNFRADAAQNADGVLDYDGDGAKDELGIGCEACHGPGSEHVAGGPALGKNIVLPNLLSAERADQICGSCHTRGEGHGTIGGDHTEFPSAGTDVLTFPYPGMSPEEFVAEYHTANPGVYADDVGHSRQHHQQYLDHLKSAHYKNPYERVSCGDCHDLHNRDIGPSLKLSADDNKLCMSCHAPYDFELSSDWTKEQEGVAVAQHMVSLANMSVGYDPTNVSGVAVETATGGVGQCAACHMPKTASSQSRFMTETVSAQAQPTGRRIRGDISSHVFDAVMPAQSQVLFTAGGDNNQLPNSCGSCHNDVTGIEPRYTW